MINIWESQTHLTEENKQKDGSYPIKGSHGFGPEELVYPREYYQELYDAEEMYEILLQIHINELNGKPNDPKYPSSYLQDHANVLIVCDNAAAGLKSKL